MEKKSNNQIFVSLCIAAVVCVCLLLFQASKTGVSSVLLPSDLAGLQGTSKQRLRVAGRVTNDQIDYRVEPNFRLSFSIRDPEANSDSIAVPVLYEGIKPDMFASGRDVILDGSWNNDHFFASKLMTQCPSKYEPPSPGQNSYDNAPVEMGAEEN